MAQEPTSLSDILSDKPAVEAPVETVKEEAPPPKETAVEDTTERVTSHRREHRAKEFAAQGRDPDTGQFLPKDEEKPKAEAKEPVKEEPKAEAKPVEAPKEELTPKERAAFAAAADERRKRQALEAELAKMRAVAPPPAAAPKEGEQPKKFWDDPEGAMKAQEDRLAQRETSFILNTTERLARAKYQDFDEKLATFGEIIQKTPSLAAQWLAAPDPAEYAYQTGKTHQELRDAGGLEQLRVKMEKDIREKVEKEFRERSEKERAERASIPPSLSSVRGGGAPQQRAEWSGPTPLLEVLKG